MKQEIKNTEETYDERQQNVDIYKFHINEALRKSQHGAYDNAVRRIFFSDYHPFITSKYDFDSIFFPLFDEYVKKHNLTEEEATRLLR